MKRVEVERQAIARALHDRNITEAARSLGVARRTLQNRMRDYDMPRGEAGRPREVITGGGVGVVGALAVIAGVVGLGYWAGRSGAEAIAGGRQSADLRGLDIIRRR